MAQIREKILSGELPAGEKLPTERDLALSLGVNRATVREALKKLEMLGLVSINHGDGIYVKDYLESGNLDVLKSLIYREGGMDPEMIKSILDIRNILGPEMAALAAKNRSAEDIAKLKLIIEQGDAMPVLEADLEVHHAIARAAGNFLNVFILNFFNQLFRDYGPLYFDDPENSARSRKFHREIVNAISSGSEKNARRIMREVLEYAARRTMEAVRSRK